MRIYLADNDNILEPDIPSPSEFEEQMKELAKHDNAAARHCDMDNLMCDILEKLGYQKGVEIFRRTHKWYA